MEQNATVPLLRLCPGLRKLDFTPREDPKPGLIKIIALVQRGHLTQLKSLGFNSVDEVGAAVVLEVLNQVQDMFLRSKIDSDRSVQALARHFATLEQVSISADCNRRHKRLSLNKGSI
ncbi:hypothetical protein CPB97_006864 [Podila verticillata]|nr:hypothetical protein CPB97_006864 [Podila verticillata]